MDVVSPADGVDLRLLHHHNFIPWKSPFPNALGARGALQHHAYRFEALDEPRLTACVAAARLPRDDPIGRPCLRTGRDVWHTRCSTRSVRRASCFFDRYVRFDDGRSLFDAFSSIRSNFLIFERVQREGPTALLTCVFTVRASLRVYVG